MKSMLREFRRPPVRRLVARLLRSAVYGIDGFDAFAGRSAVVFAPHPDDETLGCGGVIAKKIRAGADVTVVFITNGAASHAAIMPRDELRTLRMKEAGCAVSVLGVREESKAVFFDYEDGKLSTAKGLDREILRVLTERRPDQIFVPSRWDFTPDHQAAYRGVVQALRSYPHRVVTWEYPVWFWMHWPFAPRSAYGVKLRVQRIVDSGASMARLPAFTHAVNIREVRDIKIAALLKYNTQMTRYVPTGKWLTLRGIARGEFLDCFLQEWEIFRPTVWTGETAAVPVRHSCQAIRS